MPLKNRLHLSKDCVFKMLETPCIYNIKKDELYELDEEAFGFLNSYLNGYQKDIDKESRCIIDFCIKEGILVAASNEIDSYIPRGSSPRPSLRYLELLLTDRCNLSCRHCYLDRTRGVELSKARVAMVMEEFEDMQGLRLILSGGEPMMHTEFWEINERLGDYAIRSVLLTNCSLINELSAKRLNVHEVQVSLDGLEYSHDYIRGQGSFRKVMDAIGYLKDAGMDVSAATMVHRLNKDEFPRMKDLLFSLGIKEWNIDAPCLAGDLVSNRDLIVDYSEAIECMSFAYGGGNHGGSQGYACGSHLAGISPEGNVVRCGFFRDAPVSSIEEGLKAGWNRLEHLRLDELQCSCRHIDECRGGCRYRAVTHYNDILAPDPLFCTSYGRG